MKSNNSKYEQKYKKYKHKYYNYKGGANSANLADQEYEEQKEYVDIDETKEQLDGHVYDRNKSSIIPDLSQGNPNDIFSSVISLYSNEKVLLKDKIDFLDNLLKQFSSQKLLNISETVNNQILFNAVIPYYSILWKQYQDKPFPKFTTHMYSIQLKMKNLLESKGIIDKYKPITYTNSNLPKLYCITPKHGDCTYSNIPHFVLETCVYSNSNYKLQQYLNLPNTIPWYNIDSINFQNIHFCGSLLIIHPNNKSFDFKLFINYIIKQNTNIMKLYILSSSTNNDTLSFINKYGSYSDYIILFNLNINSKDYEFYYNNYKVIIYEPFMNNQVDEMGQQTSIQEIIDEFSQIFQKLYKDIYPDDNIPIHISNIFPTITIENCTTFQNKNPLLDNINILASSYHEKPPDEKHLYHRTIQTLFEFMHLYRTDIDLTNPYPIPSPWNNINQQVPYLDNFINTSYNICFFYNTLTNLINNVFFSKINITTSRIGCLCKIPLVIYITDVFKEWYYNLKCTNHILTDFNVEKCVFVGTKPVYNTRYLLFWIAHVNIFISLENRYKYNEIIIGRPDVCSTLLYYQEDGSNIYNTKICVIKEMRSPGRTLDGYIYELPGGSNFKPSSNPLDAAIQELEEETGIHTDLYKSDNLSYEGFFQLASTVSTHGCHLFSYKLSSDEFNKINSHLMECPNAGKAKETECTYVQFVPLNIILGTINDRNYYTYNTGETDTAIYNTSTNICIDASMLGIILTTLLRKSYNCIGF